jgi:hypothetical protein
MWYSSFNVIVLILAAQFTLTVSLISTGTTVSLDGIAYYLPSDPVVRIPLPRAFSKFFNSVDFVPVTVANTNKKSFGATDLENLVTTFSSSDDVFQSGFLKGEPSPFNPTLVDENNPFGGYLLVE